MDSTREIAIRIETSADALVSRPFAILNDRIEQRCAPA